jgi:RND family efflux transporter MFP subunit
MCNGFSTYSVRASCGLLSTVLLGLAVGCAPQAEAPLPPPPTVYVAKPIEKEFVEKLEFTGNLRATETVQLRSRVSGYLEKIHFKDGDDVDKGDLLFTIEQEPFQVALSLAKAAHEKAEANLKLAKAEWDRTEPLVQRGALSIQERDVKTADVALATADVNSALAAIRQAELNLSYTEVRAPIRGRIDRHLVDEGNLVEAQMSMLTTIESFSPIWAYFGVGENDMLLLERAWAQQGDSAQALKVRLGFTNDGTFPFKGDLDFTQLGVDQSTGTQMRRARFANEDKKLKPGMFVRVQAALGKPRPRIMVPERAVSVDQQGEYLLVVNDKKQVERRDVKLGTEAYGLRVVEEGATLSDVLVVNGLQRARIGAEVQAEEAKELPGVDKKFLQASGDLEEGTSEQPKAAVAASSGE